MDEPNLTKSEIEKRMIQYKREIKRLNDQLAMSNSIIKTQLLKKHLGKVEYELEFYNKLLSRY